MVQLKIDKTKIVKGARQFIGCQWRHRGRSKYGIDCIGLVVKAMQYAGFEMTDRVDYGREPWRDGLRSELINHFGEPLVLSEMQPGDVVLMKWESQPAPAHVGIIGAHPFGGLTVIHSYSEIRVTEHRIDAEWLARMVEVYRL